MIISSPGTKGEEMIALRYTAAESRSLRVGIPLEDGCAIKMF